MEIPGLKRVVKASASHFLILLIVLLILSNLFMLIYFSIENARLREAIETEQKLYEEAIQLREQEWNRYEDLYSKLLKALEVNKELNTTLRSIPGSVVIPYNYTSILKRG
jgi:ABC-type maltose transport system permease subunit